MKKLATFFTASICILCAAAQPAQDTTLKQQKENIIKETTIVKVENLGELINTGNPEMRPTISADGNLLFFIRQNDPANIQYQISCELGTVWY